MNWYLGQYETDDRGANVCPSWGRGVWDVAGRALILADGAGHGDLLGTGDLREVRVADSTRSLLKEAYKLDDLGGGTLAELLGELWTVHTPLCLMPDGRLRLRIHFGDAEPIYEESFDVESRAGQNVMARLRLDYAAQKADFAAESAKLTALADRTADRVRADALRERAAKLDIQHEKVLGGLCEKYRVEPTAIHATDKPRKPETTYTEDFNGADKAGVGYDNTWTEPEGTGWNNSSNAARFNNVASGDHSARLDSDLSSSDHYAQASLVAHSRAGSTIGSGPAVRFAAAAETYYYLYHYDSGTATKQGLYRQVTGTHTQIGSDSGTISYSGLPKVAKLQASGSTITRYYDGSLLSTDTDTNIPGNVRCGLYGFANNASNVQTWDDFTAADVAAAITVPLMDHHYRMLRCA